MPQAPWPRGLFRRRSEKYELSRASRTEQNGETVWEFDNNPPEQIRGFLRPPERSETMDFTIEGTGEQTTVSLLLDVLEMGERSPDAEVPEKYVVDPPIESGDRLVTSQGKFRIVDPTLMHHSGVSRYALIPDHRGEDAGSGGSGDDPYEIA